MLHAGGCASAGRCAPLPLEKLCDAAKIVAEIVDEQPDAEGDRNQLHGALVKFLEGWA